MRTLLIVVVILQLPFTVAMATDFDCTTGSKTIVSCKVPPLSGPFDGVHAAALYCDSQKLKADIENVDGKTTVDVVAVGPVISDPSDVSEMLEMFKKMVTEFQLKTDVDLARVSAFRQVQFGDRPDFPMNVVEFLDSNAQTLGWAVQEVVLIKPCNR